MRETLGSYVRECRKALGLTQEQVAIKLEKRSTWISQIESDQARPNAEFLEALAPVIHADATKLARLREQGTQAAPSLSQFDWEPYWANSTSIDEFFTEIAEREHETCLMVCLTSPPSGRTNQKIFQSIHAALVSNKLWFNLVIPFKGAHSAAAEPLRASNEYAQHQTNTIETARLFVLKLLARLPPELHNRVRIWSPMGDQMSVTVPPLGYRVLFWIERGKTAGDPWAEDAGVVGWTDLPFFPRRFIKLGGQVDGQPIEIQPDVVARFRDYLRPIWLPWYNRTEESVTTQDHGPWLQIELPTPDPDSELPIGRPEGE